ncbi:hypothetical protein H5410_041988 [Solanum commersonii]|uniref:Uncharacterized protein n=1 Tax=Solanum commersonii TaxID=4109 RepID=A0A9J5XUP9_SOLCO|nr:hypothetical protein H5410_041988 [Solanum commersonii]
MDHPSFNAELRSKRLHDPAIMTNQSSKKRNRKRKCLHHLKQRMQKLKRKGNMKYVIKHIPKQSLKFGPTYNSSFN